MNGPVIVSSLENLPPSLAASVTPEEKAYLGTLGSGGRLPFSVTSHFASLAEPSGEDPVRRQFFPDPREEERTPWELDDPLGEACHRAAPRLIHQYRDRALLKTTGICAGYCRYCFRRVWMGTREGFIREDELKPVLEYLSAHPEIREILVSGGDPLTAGDKQLGGLFGELRRARPGILLRICSRIPVVLPSRITSELIALFREWRPLRMVVHLNHPRELAPQILSVFAALIDAGIPVHVQTVLLKGINDSPELLAELFRECADLGLTPYYLFQGDLAPGTAHFRVPLEAGLAIYRHLRKLVSGLALPVYAVDLPGGGGKIPLHDRSIAGERRTPRGPEYLLRGPDGSLWSYPKET
ncbi:KamA family radical SAM protein [Breznakiella homolactica]|uniref:KamA family radical SAM protein n=1 Tax=Breznakiella homolactica TaxID=2798577 RepID=A0A7T7XN32_9SPIR|nr:KamA family radical SAM protein [Breznakiella homolactica]QQO09268.1 KamA family radical SAM protein [Breznakiella homolactica]